MDKSELKHTQTVDQLAAELKDLGISGVPRQPNTYPELNPMDIYRSHITENLSPLTGVDSKIVYSALQWTQTLALGRSGISSASTQVKRKKT